MGKKKTKEEILNQETDDLTMEHARWIALRDYGGQDPFYADGVNMNLVRNHIIYGRGRIEEICKESGLPLPEIYFRPVPPETDNGYMASDQENKWRDVREKRIRQMGQRITHKKPQEIPAQTTLF